MDHSDSVVVAIDGEQFTAPRALLAQSSPVFRAAAAAPIVHLERGIAGAADVAALLQHLARPQPLATFAQTARVLRAATQFRFAAQRAEALARLAVLYPSAPAPFAYARWPHLHDAAQLALDCGAREVLPALLYGIVTTSEFDVDEPAEALDDTQALQEPPAPGALSPAATRLCVKLMHRIMDHFTPILFTVPTSAAHMACTGVFADHWMEHAIQPAITDSGVYRPLETLHKIQAVDWRALGLCAACCVEKRAEWQHEADDIWERIARWAELDAVFRVGGV